MFLFYLKSLRGLHEKNNLKFPTKHVRLAAPQNAAEDGGRSKGY